MLRSSVNYVGKTTDYSDYVYYNADIINNETRDRAAGLAIKDPVVKFNETRDAPLIRDASQYHFSIVRFTMDGPNRDLPLFIPQIQAGTGQTNVDLTQYAMAVSLQQTWNVTIGGVPTAYTFNIVPRPRFIQYVSETQNPELAPTPRNLASINYRGAYSAITTYQPGDIVATSINTTYNIGVGPFYRAIATTTGNAPPNTAFWQVAAGDLGQPQDLSSRYYWVYTYQHWLNLWNQTMLDKGQLASVPGVNSTCAIQDLYNEFALAWASVTADVFPYPTLNDFLNSATTAFCPQITYDTSSKLFTIFGDSDGFGERTRAFTPAVLPALGATTTPRMRLFFNGNMFNLFANFDNLYWNTVNPTIGPFAGLPIWVDALNNGPNTPTPEGYANEILFTNKFWTNVADYRLPPYTGVAGLGYVVPNGSTSTPNQQKVYWLAKQDYPSTDFWSPISSIVFTSTLLPVKTEFTGQPIVLGESNTQSATTQNAFQPIITDITLPLTGGSEDYRQLLSYVPAAEYRLSDFTSSHEPIQQIDVQVYWKNRLDSQLYPITMTNGSSVSIKMMFRHKEAA